jgi:cell filamentation protein
VDVSKPGVLFCRAQYIESEMLGFEADRLLIHTPCRPKSVQDISESLPAVHSELLLIHPFREGNGRTARWLADLMAVQAGYRPPAYQMDGRGSLQRKSDYFEALRLAYNGNLKPLISLFASWLEVAVRRLQSGPAD